MTPKFQVFRSWRRGSRLEEQLLRSRSVAWAAWASSMIVLGLTVIAGALHLRVHLREHLAQRDGEVLAAVAMARQYANGSGSNLTQRLSNPADQLALVLEISQIQESVLGVRLFDESGRFETAFPPTLAVVALGAADLRQLRALRSVSRFHANARLADQFLFPPETAPSPEAVVPLLEVAIPLYPRGGSNLVAVAQLLLDGRAVAAEYARVDEHLWLLGFGLYGSGAVLLSAVLLWAYQRLRRSHALLEERTARLLRANHELALAAKTSALGTVSAHLIHGLSNPLANLQDFIASHGGGAADGDLRQLADSTRRMQQLVHEVVRVLSEEQGGERYEITLAELVSVLNQKLQPAVTAAGIHLATILSAAGTLSNRDANLILLILENLVQNAIKVTPRDRSIYIRLMGRTGQVFCEVEDQGKGISPEILPRLFVPCRSTQGGSGLGLAISKQLANQLGAELRLKTNLPSGCVFALTLPATLFTGRSNQPGGPELKEEVAHES